MGTLLCSRVDTALSSPCQPSSSPSFFIPPPQAWCSLLLKASLLVENYQSMNYLQLGLSKNATSVTFRGSPSLNLSIGPQTCRQRVRFLTVFWASTITGIYFLSQLRMLILTKLACLVLLSTDFLQDLNGKICNVSSVVAADSKRRNKTKSTQVHIPERLQSTLDREKNLWGGALGQ